MKLPLSLVIITLNEEKYIADCIMSVPFASEIIVVDSFSTDKTSEIAQGEGAKVLTQKFLGYRKQKQFALGVATQEWVLSLDADERLSEELQNEISSILGNPKFNGYRMPRCSFHLGRWIRHGGWYPDYQTRLFRKELAKWSGGEVHEHVVVSGSLGTLKNEIQHFVFSDLADQIETNNEFSSLGARELAKQNRRFSLAKLVFKPMGKFFECYFWKLGFLDGVAGFIIALGAAQSLFLKYSKLWEAQEF